MAKKKSDKTLSCLKKCMFREDRKSHKAHEGKPGGMKYLDSKRHTDDLLDRCVPSCMRRKKRAR